MKKFLALLLIACLVPLWSVLAADPATCTHSGKKLYTVERISLVYTDDGNGKTHTYSGDGWDVVTCAECGKELERTKFKDRTAHEAHTYDPFGCCTGCGYRKPQCAHEFTREEVVYAADAKYTAVDAATHKVTGTRYRKIYCRVCGKLVNSINDGERTETEPHEFEGDVCKKCGYSRACRHTHTTDRRKVIKLVAIRRITPENHTLFGMVAIQTVCDDCGEILESVELENMGEVTEEHTLAGGTCSICGYSSTCTHPRKKETVRFDPKKEKYTPVDGETHLHEGHGWIEETCQVCGATFSSVEQESLSVSEPHSFVGRVCEHCGYTIPSETATPAPTATPEPTPTPAPTPKPLATEVTVGGGLYRLDNENRTAEFAGMKDAGAASVSVRDKVKANGKSYHVTSIAANACRNMAKLKKATIGKYVASIGERAFYGCTLLKKVTVKTKLLKTAAADAFRNIAAKAVFDVPSSRKKAYKDLFVKMGAPKTASFK